MSYLYGDSTAFPYDVDYIELSRHGLDCALQLLSAQHAIASALSREEAQNQQRNVDRARLVAMSEAVESALAPFLSAESDRTTVQAAVHALQTAKASLDDERADAEQRATAAASHARLVIQRAGESAHRALELFLVRHDVPETALGVTLSWATEQSYAGQIAVRSPFGVSATFALRIGPDHPWSRPRRVGDLVPSLEVHVPQPAGWISRRVELARLKLDRLFLSSIRAVGGELELELRKAAGTGSGYRVSVDLLSERSALLTALDENGLTDSDPPLALEGEDGARVLELSQRVIESIQGLTSLRGDMISVALDDRPLEQLEWPETAAHRLLEQLAPLVLEISRRSGAPGELVLRRDVGDGRREEIYVTKAELWERLLVLPPERRAPFAALGLSPPVLAPPLEVYAPAAPIQLQPLPMYELAAHAAIVSVGPAA